MKEIINRIHRLLRAQHPELLETIRDIKSSPALILAVSLVVASALLVIITVGRALTDPLVWALAIIGLTVYLAYKGRLKTVWNAITGKKK
jgi:hypothetical protein